LAFRFGFRWSSKLWNFFASEGNGPMEAAIPNSVPHYAQMKRLCVLIRTKTSTLHAASSFQQVTFLSAALVSYHNSSTRHNILFAARATASLPLLSKKRNL
jgi:hypothetical protein